MADRRPESEEMSRAKRAKVDLDPKENPYLAHMYENNEEGGYSNGQRQNGNGDASILSTFTRHETTAAQAHKAEDGPANPFNNQPLSSQYFNILKTRRDLPVQDRKSVV